MLLKLTDEACINPDYVINLYYREKKAGNEPIRLEEQGEWEVLARMIDGTVLSIHSGKSQEDVRSWYENFIKQSNIHISRNV